MDLQELKVLVDYAIDDCQRIIQKDPKTILSEGDFERILSDCISKQIGYNPGILQPDEYAVHSQITHYDNESDEVDARVDILLAKPADIKPDWSRNKLFVIYNPIDSFAIELKYKHKNNGCVSAAKKDIKKYVKYKDDSHYYSIILLDNNKNIVEQKNEIQEYYEKKKRELGEEYENKFFCRVLIKEAE